MKTIRDEYSDRFSAYKCFVIEQYKNKERSNQIIPSKYHWLPPFAIAMERSSQSKQQLGNNTQFFTGTFVFSGLRQDIRSGTWGLNPKTARWSLNWFWSNTTTGTVVIVEEEEIDIMEERICRREIRVGLGFESRRRRRRRRRCNDIWGSSLRRGNSKMLPIGPP